MKHYSVKLVPLKNAMLKYWCVFEGDNIIFYYLSRIDALDKLEELSNSDTK